MPCGLPPEDESFTNKSERSPKLRQDSTAKHGTIKKVPTTRSLQINMNIDLKFVELTADVLENVFL